MEIASFSEYTKISARNPDIAVSNSTIYVAWWQPTFNGGDLFPENGGDLFFASENFSNLNSKKIFDSKISIIHENVFSDISPNIAASEKGDRVYIAWRNETITQNGEIINGGLLLARSIDYGKTFSVIKLSNDTVGDPQISAYGKNVYVIWNKADFKLALAKSTDYGNSFHPTIDLNIKGFDPRISTDGSNVYAIWSNNTRENLGLYFTTIRINETNSNYKITKLGDIGIGTILGSHMRPMQIGAGGGNIFVVWSHHMGQRSVIFFSASSDNGSSFSSPVKVSGDDTCNCDFPVLANSPFGMVYLAWIDFDFSPGIPFYLSIFGSISSEIAFTMSDDNGKTFSNVVDISQNGGESWYPSLETFSYNNVSLIWQDHTYGNPNIFLTKSQNNGFTFGDITDINLDGKVTENPQKLYGVLTGLVTLPLVYAISMKKIKNKRLYSAHANENSKSINIIEEDQTRIQQVINQHLCLIEQYRRILLSANEGNFLTYFNCKGDLNYPSKSIGNSNLVDRFVLYLNSLHPNRFVLDRRVSCSKKWYFKPVLQYFLKSHIRRRLIKLHELLAREIITLHSNTHTIHNKDIKKLREIDGDIDKYIKPYLAPAA